MGQGGDATLLGETLEEDGEQLPFELVVLEGILNEVCEAYSQRCDLYRPVVRKTLQRDLGGDDDGGIEGLHRLSAFDGALSAFEAETHASLRVLVELLASDEDMLGLLVSERLQQRDLEGGGRGDPIDPERHAVVELLLESYHRRLAFVAHAVGDLRGEVAQARDLARVTIDLHRNHIIKFNLYLSMTAVGLAATTRATTRGLPLSPSQL